jgi:hypothetical protein
MVKDKILFMYIRNVGYLKKLTKLIGFFFCHHLVNINFSAHVLYESLKRSSKNLAESQNLLKKKSILKLISLELIKSNA